MSPKTFDSYFLDMMHVEFMKNFLLADSSELMGCETHFGLLSPVEFMKNFLLADSSVLMAVGLISSS